jgi:hypothetical protein
VLPKITKNKFSSGYEKAQYFAELLDGYINLNKNTHEPTTEYNIMCINLINSAIDDKLNPMIIKLAIIGKISYESKDYGTNRNCYQIISSLQKQRNYYRMCRDTLEKAAINKNYYIIIKSNLNRGVVDRCNRLNESLLPNLIEESKLNVYVDFLAGKGSTLEEDFKKYADCDFDSEEFHHYVALVSKRIDRHLKSVSEKKRAELLAGFERHKLLEQQRNEEKAISKVAKKEDTLREIKDNLSSKVTQIYDNAMLVQTAYMQTGSVAQKLYQRIDELISDKSVDAYLNDRVVVVALHPRNKSFSTSNIKYYVSGRKTLVTDMTLASVLLERYDVQEIQGVVYKLCSKSAEFRSLNKEFNDCFSSIKKHRIYLHTPLESTNNLIAFYLECLSAIKLEGISMQQAFKDCPSIEKYYRECLHSDLKAFVKMIGYKAENTSNLYRAVKKIKENT